MFLRTAMRAVSRFEHNLLRILHFFLRRVPWDQVRQLVTNRADPDPPPCLSRDAVQLVQDTLAKGCTVLLAREGGWRPERFLRNDRPVNGRLWQRTPPAELGLSFSRHTLTFLFWITAAKPADVRTAWQVPEAELTVGDLLLLFFAYQRLRETELGLVLRGRTPFPRHVLCRLAFPEDFALLHEKPLPDFDPWTSGPGACILEALQQLLAARWIEVERQKVNITDWQRMRGLGQSQEQVLTPFLEAIRAAERRDLARFLVQAAAEVLVDGLSARHWVGGLQNAGPRLADRMETNQAALALVRQMDRLRQWERQARSVGYFDDGYARSQFWLADWERWQGDLLHGRAQTLVRQLDPISPTEGRQPSGN
jgi:hypothetical protein